LRGDRITQLRKKYKKTQYDLADEIGVSQNLISRYERGALNPSMETLLLLCDALHTTADYLLGRSDKQHADAEPDAHPDLTPTEQEMLTLLRQYDLNAQKRLIELVKLAGEIKRAGDE